MLALRLPEEMEKRLESLASKTGRSKSFYVRKAIDEFLEDREDYLLAVARLEENNEKVPFEEIEKLIDGK